MATLYGVQATKILNTFPPKLAEQGYSKGRVYCLSDKFTLTADLAAGDVIKMGSMLPKGARVIDVRLAADDLDASGGTLDVGWQASPDVDGSGTTLEAADQDGFLAVVDVTSASVTSMWTGQRTRPGYQKVFAGQVQPVITTVGDTDATTGDVYLDIFYVID